VKEGARVECSIELEYEVSKLCCVASSGEPEQAFRLALQGIIIAGLRHTRGP
jgi:hypothetical protein